MLFIPRKNKLVKSGAEISIFKKINEEEIGVISVTKIDN